MLIYLQNKSTALHEAAQQGSNNVIIYLLDNGADVNAVNNVSYHNMLLLLVCITYMIVAIINFCNYHI